MLDRVLKLIVTLTLLLFLVQAVVGLVCRVLETMCLGTVSAIGHAASLVGGLLVVVGVACLFVGLGVRVHQLLTGQGSRAGREHGARERQVRLTVRRPAEGVPAATVPELPEDPDPALSMEDT